MQKQRTPVLNIIIPVYNEKDNFPGTYKEIKSKIKFPHKIFVVYDFNEDNTVPVVKKYLKKDKGLVLVKNNLGRGPHNAIKTGFRRVTSGPILVMMGDLCDDLSIVENMLQQYLNGANIVCASRYMKGGKQIGGSFFKRSLSKLAGNSLYYIKRLPTHDITNNFRMYDSKILKDIKIESKGGFEIAMEVTIKAFKKGYKIVEIPTTWKDRTAGESNFKLRQWLPSYLYWYVYALF